jgi:hypothetical protein
METGAAIAGVNPFIYHRRGPVAAAATFFVTFAEDAFWGGEHRG